MKGLELGDRRAPAAVAVITLIGLALRLWGIGWSLPDARHPISTYHPDELVNLTAAQEADIPHGKFDVKFYNYGTLYFYIVNIGHTMGRVYHLIPASPPDDMRDAGQAAALKRLAPERAGLFLTGRLITALMGAATIPIVFALGRRLYDIWTGLLGAFLYCLAPLAVVHAHFLTVDVPATLFVSLALLWAAILLERQCWRDVILAGVWCGLAAATKYSAAICMAAPLTALVIAALGKKEQDKTARARHRALHAGALMGVSAIAFLLACPGPWINWTAFWNGTYPGSGVRYELFEHARLGHGYLFVNTGPGWWYQISVSLRYGLGLPLLLLSAAGAAYAVRRRDCGDLMLLIFLGLGLCATSFSAVRFARYLIPLYPALCVLAARMVVVSEATAAFRRAGIACGALVVVTTGVTSFCLSRAMAAADPRDRAADYLTSKAQPQASIAFAHIPWYYSPPLSPVWGALRSDVRANGQPGPPVFEFRVPDGDWDRRVLSPTPDYVVLSNLELQNEWRRLRLQPAVEFMNSIGETAERTVFEPAAVPFLSPNDPNAPQDLLYVMPEITVIAPVKRMVAHRTR